MFCPLMSKAAECPPIKIECGEDCAWYIGQFETCAMVELVNRTDVFEISAAISDVSSEVEKLQDGLSGIIQTLYDR